MKELNLHIDVKVYQNEELNEADRQLVQAAREATKRSYSQPREISFTDESRR